MIPDEELAIPLAEAVSRFFPAGGVTVSTLGGEEPS